MSTSVNEPGFPVTPAPRPGGRDPKAPGLAVVLSLLPGLGQVYNGQPAKAFVFFFAWVGSIYGAAEVNPFPFAFLIPFVYFYNLVDAYRSAALINLKAAGGAVLDESTDESPAWGWSLVALGAVLLANNLGWLRLAAFARYWPLLLVVAGGAFVYSSVQKKKTGEADGGPRF